MSVSKWPRLQHLDEQLPWLRIRHGFETRRDPRPSRVLGMIVQKHCCLAMVLPHPAHPAKWPHQDRLMYVVLLRTPKISYCGSWLSRLPSNCNFLVPSCGSWLGRLPSRYPTKQPPVSSPILFKKIQFIIPSRFLA